MRYDLCLDDGCGEETIEAEDIDAAKIAAQEGAVLWPGAQPTNEVARLLKPRRAWCIV